MKALSILQPWAHLIVAGHKDIENRTWPTKMRGEILVHAGKGFDLNGYTWLKNNFWRLGFKDAGAIGDLLDKMDPYSFLRGGIVGKVEITDCVKGHTSPWAAADCYHFVLAKARPLSFLPMRGKLSFFDAEMPQEPAGWQDRVRQLEAEGLSRSDAQGVADVEFGLLP